MARRPRSASRKHAPSEGSSSRPLWSGTLGFGLVQIPVRLLAAESHEDLSFHQLDSRDLSRIRYERVSEQTGKKVDWKDIVKGYEMPDGRYVVVEDEDFEKANVQATRSIDIQDFVDRDQISPMYFERPYVLVPDRGAAKAYAILRDAMKKKGYVAIGRVVIRARQHLCAILPIGDALVLEILRFEEDLKPLATNAPGLPKAAVAAAATKKETALAERLIDSLRAEWDPSKYQDTYRHDLLRAIESKAKTGKLPPSRRAAPAPSNVADLAALLEKSLSRAGGSKRHKAA
jgi:DNA end-binding protein Ku